MRAHSMRSRFGEQAQRRRDCDDIGEYDRERGTDHAGKFSDLNHGPLGVEGDAKTVPAKTAEEPTAHPFMRRPCAGREKRHEQIAPRSSERLRFYQSDQPAPESEMEREIDRQQQ